MKRLTVLLLTVTILALSFSTFNVYADEIATEQFHAELISDGKLLPVTTKVPSDVTVQSVNAKLYDVLLQGLINMDKTINIASFRINLNKNSDVTNMVETFSAVVNENPGLFYIDPAFSVNYSTFTGYVTELVPQYIDGAAEKKSVFEQETAEILSKCIRKGMTDEDKVLALHDYLASECDYNYGTLTAQDFTSYGIIVDKLGVCQSYSQAYNYLLSLLGIETKLCVSDGVYDADDNLVSGMDHGWSLVKLNGNWYHVDVTWDDPNVGSDMKGLKLAFHTYFLLSDESMADPDTGKHYDWVDDVECTDKRYETGYPFLKDENREVPVSSASYYPEYLPYFPHKYNTQDNLFYSRLYVPGAEVYYKTDFTGEKFEYITSEEYQAAVGVPQGVSAYSVINLTDKSMTFADINNLSDVYVTFENNAPTATDGVILIVQYDGDDKFIFMESTDISFAGNDSKTVNITPTAAEGAEKFKIFIWHTDTLTEVMVAPVEF